MAIYFPFLIISSILSQDPHLQESSNDSDSKSTDTGSRLHGRTGVLWWSRVSSRRRASRWRGCLGRSWSSHSWRSLAALRSGGLGGRRSRSWRSHAALGGFGLRGCWLRGCWGGRSHAALWRLWLRSCWRGWLSRSRCWSWCWDERSDGVGLLWSWRGHDDDCGVLLEILATTFVEGSLDCRGTYCLGWLGVHGSDRVHRHGLIWCWVNLRV